MGVDVLEPLDAVRDCPLMPAALVERYNQLAACIKAARSIPRLQVAIGELIEGLGPIRTRITRRRYQVGFLGRNQVGKSTALCNILGVGKDRAPSTEGGIGEATTSVITRVRAKESGGDTLTLRYLDEAGYRSKRAAVCRAIGLPEDLTDTELERELPRREQEIAKGKGELALAADPRYLRKLLLSARQFPDRIARPDTEAPYEQRTKILNHDHGNNEPTPYLLLRDAVIDFQTDRLDKNMELIDLPGLGAQVAVDSFATTEFLRDLDGAIVVAQTGNLSDQSAYRVLGELRKAFEGDFAGRVWLAISHFDHRNEEFFRGNFNKDTGFDSIVRLASDGAVPLSQVCFVSRDLFKGAMAALQAGQAWTAEKAAKILGVPADWPVPPPEVSRYPDLVDPFKALLDDGGIGRLRDLLQKTLVQRVKARLEEWLADQMSRLARRLNQAVEFTSRTGNLDQLPDVQRCLNAIHGQIQELGGRCRLFGPPAKQIGDELREYFLKNLFPVNDFLNIQPLHYAAERFPGHAHILQQQLDYLVQTQLVPAVFGPVGDALSGLPRVPVAGQDSPASAWAVFAELDRDPEVWRTEQYPRFENPDLFIGMQHADADAYNGLAYRELILEKIRTTVHEVCHVLRHRLRTRLFSLQGELEELSKIQPGEGNVAKNAYTNLLNQLRPLCQ